MDGLYEGLSAQGDKDLLRFLTCGSVDDGKSTLIGRLLYDCSLILDDQLATLEEASRRFGTTGDSIDFRWCLTGSRMSASSASRSMSPIGSLRRESARLS